jgi:hypothetical protein
VFERDSAGIKIVESFEGSWTAGEGWRLSEQPVVTIGAEEGPEEYSLFQVAAALRLPDGRIVVANNGSDELRYYGSSGLHLYSVGRDGYGPGEFKMMRGVWLVEDSLVVYDYGQDRVSVFSASGEYARTLMLHREPGSFPPYALGVFSDGSILGMELLIDRRAASQSGLRFDRTYALYRRYSRDAAVLDSLGAFLFLERVAVRLEVDEKLGVGRAVGADSPFGRRASVVAFGEHLYHGSSDTYEVQVFRKEGTLERIIRRPISNTPVTARDKELFLEDFEGGREWGRRWANELEFPETMPAYGSVHVDAVGNVWVAKYSLGREDRAGEWTVFDSAGRMLGVVEVPVGGRIRDIGEDYLIGTWRTDRSSRSVHACRLLGRESGWACTDVYGCPVSRKHVSAGPLDSWPVSAAMSRGGCRGR